MLATGIGEPRLLNACMDLRQPTRALSLNRFIPICLVDGLDARIDLRGQIFPEKGPVLQALALAKHGLCTPSSVSPGIEGPARS
jgi:hypothetical protein